jgi:hypothetical protein
MIQYLRTNSFFIRRSPERTEGDDYELNVAPKMKEYHESVPVFLPDADGKNILQGWTIQYWYE